MLKVIYTIMEHEMFKQFPYRVENVVETIQELILYEEDDNQGGYSIKEKEWIAKLNLLFQMNDINNS